MAWINAHYQICASSSQSCSNWLLWWMSPAGGGKHGAGPETWLWSWVSGCVAVMRLSSCLRVCVVLHVRISGYDWFCSYFQVRCVCVCVCVCESKDEVSMVILSICIDLNMTLIYRVFLCNSLISVKATIHHSNVFFLVQVQYITLLKSCKCAVNCQTFLMYAVFWFLGSQWRPQLLM